MNRAFRQTIVRTYQYESHVQLWDHVLAVHDACHLPKRFKTRAGCGVPAG